MDSISMCAILTSASDSLTALLALGNSAELRANTTVETDVLPLN
jgi:hypothetical protein